MKSLTRYEDDPDPVVAALAAAHSAAVRAGERALAERLEKEVDKLSDPAYALYAAVRETVRLLDNVRYFHQTALQNIRLSPTASSGRGAHMDEFLVKTQERLRAARLEYADSKGWPV
jgi:hypothetical protein